MCGTVHSGHLTHQFIEIRLPLLLSRHRGHQHFTLGLASWPGVWCDG
jgi:hypothetical protein